MPYTSHRLGPERNFDCLYDLTYSVPSEKDLQQARASALSNSTPVQVYPKYNVMFANEPQATRLLFRKQRNDLPYDGKEDIPSDADSLASCVKVMPGGGRLEAGANNPAERKAYDYVNGRKPCKQKPPGFFYNKPSTNVHVVNVKLTDSQMNANLQRHVNCEYLDKPRPKFRRTCGTQTLYRESSAQTLPYFPEIANDPNEVKNFEIIKLSKILPLDKPPGVYEVEVLERARKRWAFADKIRSDLKHKQRHPESARATEPKTQKRILEALEWENWIEREEHIQDCQMLRLELLVRMFEKREKAMHDASKMRIETALKRISANREKQLHKNKIEYERQLRHMELKRRNVPRNWRRENIISEFGDPSSEFYAPQLRYGVNPSRRHFTPTRKAFDEHMFALEQRTTVNMKNLVCPFAKINRWSKPKQRVTEVEQNFCSDTNLNNLYESLKNLRQIQKKKKVTPKCLIKRAPKQSFEQLESFYKHRSPEPMEYKHERTKVRQETVYKESLEDKERIKGYEALKVESTENRRNLHYLLFDKQQEEIEVLLAEYEGTKIGWLLRFLSEEMCRLQEQRKMHLISLLAQKERWRREAAEAGLRQKENEMRNLYECIYHSTYDANKEVCEGYLDKILETEAHAYGNQIATRGVTELAKAIDADIKRWLDTIQKVQNPMNFELLRYLLKDIIYPNATELANRFETKAIVKDLIEDMFEDIWEGLEPYDISVVIATETIDRAIDNDLLLFSSECSECESVCTCTPAKLEANAIMRKIVRRAVPGRRWKTSTERICLDAARTVLDDVFSELDLEDARLRTVKTDISKQSSHFNLVKSVPTFNDLNRSETSSRDSLKFAKVMHLQPKRPKPRASYQFTNASLWKYDTTSSSVSDYTTRPLKTVESAFDITSRKDFVPRGHDNDLEDRYSSAQYSDIGVVFGKDTPPQDASVSEEFLAHLINEVIEEFVPSGGSSEQSSRKSEREVDHILLDDDVSVDTVETFTYYDDDATGENEVFDSGETEVEGRSDKAEAAIQPGQEIPQHEEPLGIQNAPQLEPTGERGGEAADQELEPVAATDADIAQEQTQEVGETLQEQNDQGQNVETTETIETHEITEPAAENIETVENAEIAQDLAMETATEEKEGTAP